VLRRPAQGERLADLRDAMAKSMERGCGIYRLEEEMRETCEELAKLKERFASIGLKDHSTRWNTEWLSTLELGFQLDVAQAMAHSALERRESRGAHQRLDAYKTRDDVKYLKHTLATYQGDSAPAIAYSDVTITKSQPAERVYGGAAKEEAHA
jgi:fumarate reductase flavoprotein subunit